MLPWPWDAIALRRCRWCANDDVGEDIWLFAGNDLACRRCAVAALRGDLPLAGCSAAYRGRRAAARPLIAYKERQDDWAALETPLARALHDSVVAVIESRDLPDDTPVVPVPSYRNRRPHLHRLTAQLGLNARLNVLHKVRDVRQDGVGRRARYEQSRGAYRVAWGARLRGRAVILTDDMYVTGATLTSCASALLAAGATSVYGAVILRLIASPPSRPVHDGAHQLMVRFTPLTAQGTTACDDRDSRDSTLWVRFGCGARCPHVLTAGPLRTPTPHIDLAASWHCQCGVPHEIHVARVGPALRVTVPPRHAAELLIARHIHAP